MELKNQRSGEIVAVVICEEMPKIITCTWVFQNEEESKTKFPLEICG